MAKELVWLGDSLRRVRAFPDDARRQAGRQLYAVQCGEDPWDWKPMRSIGQGVKEIRLRVAKNAYRVIYTAAIGDRVYVLHAFQKTSRKTEQRDIELARQRFKALRNQK